MNKFNLTGWNYIVYTLINNNFKNKVFSLKELYEFESDFKLVYPNNYHVKEKLRQTLQNLRDKGLLEFVSKGVYKLLFITSFSPKLKEDTQQQVYLLSNESIPGWVKIGRTNSIDRRLNELYNTSVPLPFKLEESILTNTLNESEILEKSIHNIIDTLNPDLRKNTEANRREFFKMSVEEGKNLFHLVTKIINVNPTTNQTNTVQPFF